MLKYGNKDFLNLQEQVYKNMKDIQDIQQGTTVLAEFGIKVIGQVDTSEELPDPATYEGEYGDAYIVGTEEPYEYYIFTRAFEGQDEPSWFDLGEFPVPGPQGPQGEQGPAGVTPIVDMTVTSVTTLNPGQSATASITKIGTMTNPLFKVSFGIPQGAQGVNGASGAQGPVGPQGPKGDKGDKGDTGGLIEVVGIVASTDNLPDPTTLGKLDAAYLVGTSSANYHLYIQVGETTATALWTDVGLFNVGTVVTEGGDVVQTFDADTKLDKVSGNAENVVYAQTTSAPTTVVYKEAVGANTIPLRDANGQIKVPATPTSSDHAASKGYVDSATASLLPTQHAGDLLVGTSTANVVTRLAIGSAGQVLGVNSSANGLEYKTINNVPSYQGTDAEKTLKVNSLGTALEWATPTVSWSNVQSKPNFATVATSGSYDDLSDKPTIPAAQIQSDWTQSDNTKVDYIKNKPTLATVATSGAYSDLTGKPSLATVATSGSYADLIGKPTIPDAVSGVNDGTNWTSLTIGDVTKAIPQGGTATSVAWADITGKPSFASVATSGDYDDLIDKPTIPDAVSGTNDGTNWTSITIGSTTKNIPSGGGVPAYQGTDANKVLTVNSLGTNVQWTTLAESAFTGYISWSDIQFKPTFAEVAFTGSYNDLTDKPTIPEGVPAYTASDFNKVLVPNVVSGGNIGLIWTDNKPTWSNIQSKPTFATVATSGSYNDLLNKPTIPTVPTNVSSFTNDSGYITSSALSGYATETWVGQQGYLTSVSWSGVTGKPTFATVATSGSYNDLTDKPTIPTVPVTNVTVGGTSVVSQGVAVIPAILGTSTETWTFTLSDNSTVSKTVVLA